MIQVLADETHSKELLYPFAQIGQVVDIRIGILTIREKWKLLAPDEIRFTGSESAQAISSRFIPSREIVERIRQGLSADGLASEYPNRFINYPWQIATFNEQCLREDFELLTAGRLSAPVPVGVTVIGAGELFIEEGAELLACTINTGSGPVYIGKGSLIMEGTSVRGPMALCEGAVLKMGSRIYGGTTIGPFSVVGGEVKNAVIFGFSNKAHDGYLGDAVIGEWCNLGAGTSCSNVSNTASTIKVWNHHSRDFHPAGIKCGLLMGDYSRCAINTSFNTGTVVGVAANVFGSGLTPKLIPDFAWGTQSGARYDFDRALEHIRNWKKFKNKELTEQEIQRLKTIFAHT